MLNKVSAIMNGCLVFGTIAAGYMVASNQETENVVDLVENPPHYFAEDKRQLKCLAANVYFEARGSSDEDQYAVAHVTMNRVASSRYSDDVCEVVYQEYQFSWTLEDADYRTVKEEEAWYKSARVALDVMSGKSEDPTGGATHYFAHYKIDPPRWVEASYDVVMLDQHTYMKVR